VNKAALSVVVWLAWVCPLAGQSEPQPQPQLQAEPDREAERGPLAPPPPTAAGSEQKAPMPLPPTAADDEEAFNPEAAGLSFGFVQLNALLQMRYMQTFAAASRHDRGGYALREDNWIRRDDGFRLRRLYLRLRADPSPWFAARVVLNFARLDRGELKGVVRQAYGRVSPLPNRLEISAGVLELPYSIMKMDSAASLELADRGEAAELVTDLDFAGRDIGVALMFAPLAKPRHLRLTFGAFRGHAQDEHASPFGTLSARAETKPVKSLRLGVSFVHQPYDVRYARPFETDDEDVLPTPRDPLYPRERSWASGSGWSADVTYSRKRFMVRGEGMLGDRIDYDERYGARAFYALWALLAYRFEVGPLQLLPALRAEWLDADMDQNVGVRRTYTFALTAILSEHVRVLFDVTHIDVQDDSPMLDPPGPLPVMPYLDLDRTQATMQLQVEI
jgi:hypothetical protein